MTLIRTGKFCLYCSNEIIRKRIHGGTTKGRDGKDRPNDALKYCSSACAARDCGKFSSIRKVKKEPKPKSTHIYYIDCDYCNKLFIYRNRRKKYCSDECRYSYFKANGYKDAIFRSNEKRYGERKIYKCKECNREYIPDHRGRKNYCSEFCRIKQSRRIGKATRRARMFKGEMERIDPFIVFERDKWICQLCYIKTIKSKRGTINHRAPELDHIIPLSQGGPHIYANVQCVCRSCNQKKSNNIKGQLRLC